MSIQSTNQLEELVNDLKLGKESILYDKWKSEVQEIARGIMA